MFNNELEKYIDSLKSIVVINSIQQYYQPIVHI